MPSPFVHVELHSTDFEKSKDFYSHLFDWKLEQDGGAVGIPYTMIRVGGGTGGGMMRQMTPDAPSAWLPYVEVADINGATKKAAGLGASIKKDVTAVPDMGWFSIITDPTGAMIGLWQSI